MESRQMCCSTWGCINRSESEIHPIKKKKIVGAPCVQVRAYLCQAEERKRDGQLFLPFLPGIPAQAGYKLATCNISGKTTRRWNCGQRLRFSQVWGGSQSTSLIKVRVKIRDVLDKAIRVSLIDEFCTI